MTRSSVTILAACLVLGAPVLAASPAIPDGMTYQGVLLDDLGQALTGPVDLTLRVYDAISGGSLLYAESQIGVPLVDGVFSIVLGPTGLATDPPNPDPLTTSLAEAVGGDLPGTGPSRFLEVTVGSDGALMRTQILTVPYALRAESAATADLAAVATTATTATDATSVGGLSSLFVTEIWEHTNLDGSGPDNNAPSEGLGDTDGDGIANFVDSDNDDDGLSDSAEVSQGSDINLITPTISGFVPPTVDGFLTSPVTVQGTNFEPGMSVVFGTEAPVASNLTSTSFDVVVGPQPEGAASVTVTRLNGEHHTDSFPFFLVQPIITSVDPDIAFANQTTHVVVTGSAFDPGQTVTFGSETPASQNLSSTSFEVDVGPQGAGLADVTVTHPNGKSDTLADAFNFTVGQMPHLAATDSNSQFTFAVTGQYELVGGLDAYDADGTLQSYPGYSDGPAADSQLAVAVDAAGLFAGVRCIADGAGCDIVLERDTGGDFVPDTSVTLEDDVNRVYAPSIAFDGSGHPVVAYIRSVGNDAIVSHDRDGNGDFLGTNERVVVESTIGSNINRAEVAVDPSDRVGLLYWDGSGNVLRYAWDRSGDGDFADTVGANAELRTIAPLAAAGPSCVGATFAPDGDPVVTYRTAAGVSYLRDLDQDGDFDDAGETLLFDAAATGTGCDVAGDASSIAFVTMVANTVRLRVDRNDDGDFDDTDEEQDLLTVAQVEQVEVTFNDLGSAMIATAGPISTSRWIVADPVAP